MSPRLIALAILAAALAASHTWAWHTGANRAENRMALQWQNGQLKAWQAAHNDAAQQIADQATLAARAQRQRDQLAAQLQDIDREPPPPPAPGCAAWTPDQRLRLDARRAAHASIDDPRPGLLPHPLPAHPPHSEQPL